MTEILSYHVRTVSGVISTDDIIPGRYKHMHSDPKDLAPHVFENLVPGLAGSFRDGDALWCDATFGIGSSREQAATSLLAAGVRVVVAPSFGRIFYRNAWNIGLMLVEARRPLDRNLDGQTVVIDWENGLLTGAFGVIRFAVPPPRLMEISRSGGLLSWVLATREKAVQPRQLTS